MAREKYPEKCPWDFGPDQNQSHQANWKMINGEEVVIFSRKKDDQNYFYLTENNSLKSIGFHFGGRDHSTVIHAVQSVNDMIDTDSIFRNNIKEINKRISMG